MLKICFGVILLGECASKNQRMVEVGTGLWRSSGPTPLLKQGRIELVAQEHVQSAFEYRQERRLHNLAGQPVPVFGHPQSDKMFPDV